MSEHTEGPWKVKKYGSYHSIHSDSGVSIAAIDPYNEQDAANARLIAAAPNLLEACEAALELFEELYVYGETPGMIQAAIAKAKGDGDDG